MIALTTAATVIASQATISGACSITRQAMQHGYLPRMSVQHTSEKEIGQIYVPALNWLLLAAVLAAVIGFGSSSKLAAAYGVAVVGTMMITTVLTFFVIRYNWGYNLLLAVFATGFFLLVDATFFSASLLKVGKGGWFPLTVGVVTFTITWRRGRARLLAQLKQSSVPRDTFLQSLFQSPPIRILSARRVFDLGPGRGAARAAKQSRAQQGAARARGVPDGAHQGRAVGAGGRARAHRRLGAATVSSSPCTSASKTRPT